MPKLILRNNSVSGRDYRAKGIHVEIPGNSTVSVTVAADIAEKVVADIRRKSPAIRAEIIDDPVEADAEATDSVVMGEEDSPVDEDLTVVEPHSAKHKRGKAKRKPTKRQRPGTETVSIVEMVPNASEVTVEEVIE
jgi:hypothetical protein